MRALLSVFALALLLLFFAATIDAHVGASSSRWSAHVVHSGDESGIEYSALAETEYIDDDESHATSGGSGGDDDGIVFDAVRNFKLTPTMSSSSTSRVHVATTRRPLPPRLRVSFETHGRLFTFALTLNPSSTFCIDKCGVS
jgi:hypothetical protein